MAVEKMTKRAIQTKKRRDFHVAALLAVLFLIPALIFPKVLSDGVRDGIKLSVLGVIPSVFPFFVVSDALLSLPSKGGGFCGRVFSRLLGIPAPGVRAFLIGTVCGFPIGVKIASELYVGGSLKKEEAERLMGISTNPSAAFVISAVGVGFFGSVKTGLLLYSLTILSALITGIIFKEKIIKSNFSTDISGQKFDFVSSVKNAGISSITVSSYIIFFSALSAILKHVLGNGIFSLVIISLLEISGGVKAIFESVIIPPALVLPCVSFALAFSGCCVHAQARSVAHHELSFKNFTEFFEGLNKITIIQVFVYL
jgi:hypothetical protein